MKIEYDKRSDTLTMLLREDAMIADSDEHVPGFIVDYDAAGEVVSVEILDASRKMTDASRVDFSLSN